MVRERDATRLGTCGGGCDDDSEAAFFRLDPDDDEDEEGPPPTAAVVVVWKDPVDSRRVDPDLGKNARLDSFLRMISTIRQTGTKIASKLSAHHTVLRGPWTAFSLTSVDLTCIFASSTQRARGNYARFKLPLVPPFILAAMLILH